MVDPLEADEVDGVTGESGEDISELVETRRRIEGWLERLDEQAGAASREVLERVRADYRQRLEEITEQLLRRQDVVTRWLSEAEERARDASERRSQATTELEEGRLRHQIGEWSEERWGDRRTELESRIEQASEQENEARSDIHRLRQLLRDASGSRPTASPARVVAPPEEPSSPPRLVSRREAPARMTDQNAADEPRPAAAEGTEGEGATTPTPEAEEAAGGFDPPAEENLPPQGEADDVTLLPDGPASDSAADETESAAAEEFDPETIPKPGIKCGNCGYTNDAAAWFCGVCGADIG